MPKHHQTKHGPDIPRAGTAIQDSEWRLVIDSYLSGDSFKQIAQRHGRTVKAIEHIITGKVPMNYDGDDTTPREPPVEKLQRVDSILHLSRKPSRRDRLYFAKLRLNKRSPEECAVILHLSMTTIEKLQREYGLPPIKEGTGTFRVNTTTRLKLL